MKLTIEKTASDRVQISVAPDPSKKPVVFDLYWDQVTHLFQLLETARRSTKFKFEIEV